VKPYDAKRLEPYRIVDGPCASGPQDERNGAFIIPCLSTGATLKVIISDGYGWTDSGLPGEPWEHVSVSLPNRNPNWAEMCFVKSLFFDEEETVIQFHPPQSKYVNNHPHCLHLWKPPYEVVMPPILAV